MLIVVQPVNHCVLMPFLASGYINTLREPPQSLKLTSTTLKKVIDHCRIYSLEPLNPAAAGASRATCWELPAELDAPQCMIRVTWVSKILPPHGVKGPYPRMVQPHQGWHLHWIRPTLQMIDSASQRLKGKQTDLSNESCNPWTSFMNKYTLPERCNSL